MRYLHFVGKMPTFLPEQVVHLTLNLEPDKWSWVEEGDKDPIYLPFDHAREADLCLTALPSHLAKAKSLRSFAFVLERMDSPPAGFVIRQSILACIVDALPRSCTSLEIDTQGMDDGGMVTEDKLWRQNRNLARAYPELRDRILERDPARTYKDYG